MLSKINERDRIKEVYKKRQENIPQYLYSHFNYANLFMIQGRERENIKVLQSYGLANLVNKKVLEVGCGSGGELRNILRYGARPENLYGIDLLPDRIELAQELSPNVDFKCGDGSQLPYEPEMFDIVMQFTVFTSILNDEMKQAVASEMLRVLKPYGIILWYDYHMNNPRNPDVKGVKKREIKELFPDCKIDLHRITLAPPITRAIAPYSWLFCYLLEKLKIFNTHYSGVIQKTQN